MLDAFLKKKECSLTIAKLAVGVQAFLTICILQGLAVHSSPRVLLWLLWTDISFIVLHLSYRAMYRGPRVPLPRLAKKLLLAHSFTAILSLSLTFSLFFGTAVNVFLPIVSWTATLFLGILFFAKKYGLGINLGEKV
jgi:hypothetical protein